MEEEELVPPPFLLTCNFFCKALEGPMNSKLSGFFRVVLLSTLAAIVVVDGSFCGLPMVGISSMLEIVILFALSSSDAKDSSVNDKSPNTFLFVVHLLVLS